MTPKQTRLTLLVTGLTLLAGVIALALTALEDNLVYFRSPSEIAVQPAELGKVIRLGGLVKPGSLEKSGKESRFVVTDGAADIAVRHVGLLPDLFREGQGVVVEGAFETPQLFAAKTVLAKHDENYMPPEVAEALKQTGVWEGGAPQ
ncbi:MAG: cytochrome c maturation protein CcmE [Parvibaculales bacterium]